MRDKFKTPLSFAIAAVVVGILVLIATLGGCVPQGEPMIVAPKVGDIITIPSVEWRVVDQATLEREYRRAGMALTKGDKLHGFAGVTSSGKYVVYTLPPKYVDDEVTVTLGHEIEHVVLGSFHK